MKLPTITNKQQDILQLIYTYRFLKQKQVQQFLDHKDKRRSTRWLKDLKEKQYINWFYDPDTRTEPAIYFLDVNGIRWLREQSSHPEEELRKRYKDGGRQPDFIARCLLLADCVLHLEARSRNPDDPVHYDYAIAADYFDQDNDYSFLLKAEDVRPDLVYTKEFSDADGETDTTTYLAELIDPTTPSYMIRKKLKAYVSYLASGEWENTKPDTIASNELPTILIACPTLSEAIKVKRYTRNQLEETWDGTVPEEIKIRFSTAYNVRTQSITAKIWEQA